MAKRIDNKEKRDNYEVERIRQPMDRERLNQLYEEFKSDDDYINYHIDNIDDTHRRYKITILGDDNKSLFKKEDIERADLVEEFGEENVKYYAYMNKDDAIEFITEYIDEGNVNSKTKAVMQAGFSKKSLDKYKDLVEKENNEYKSVSRFTKPTFEEVMNNIYVNTYNGTTYHEKDEDRPDDLREDVGVIIPGMIETREEYFEFVKRLKDRGRNGLGRSIYDRYEDYEEAIELIDRYKQALFDKYGGKEEFFHAKQMGGLFGAYEYYPTIKPRFKKTKRNIKLDRGINLNELALIKDMGRRIREELDDEIEQIEVSHDYIIYENTPPKFRDLPEDLQIFYKTDKNNINGFTHIKNFKDIVTYAKDLVRSNDPDKQIEGYRILENIDLETFENDLAYKNEMVDIVDTDDLTMDSVFSQMEYDMLLKETNYDFDYVDSIADVVETQKAFRKFMEYQLININGWDKEIPSQKSALDELVNYAVDYAFSERFREDEIEKTKVNSAGERLYSDVKHASMSKEQVRADRARYRDGDSKLKAYVRELASNARISLERMKSNADNVNVKCSEVDIHDLTGHNTADMQVYGFELEPEPDKILTYMKNNELLTKKIYEMSSDRYAEDMFSERTNIDDFVEEATIVSKPMITKNIIKESIRNKNIRKGGN